MREGWMRGGRGMRGGLEVVRVRGGGDERGVEGWKGEKGVEV